MSSSSVLTLYVPSDTTALSLGADQLVPIFHEQAKNRGIELNLIRNGSRGLGFLEPLVEVEGVDGRYGFRNVDTNDVAAIVNAFAEGQQLLPFCESVNNSGDIICIHITKAITPVDTLNLDERLQKAKPS